LNLPPNTLETTLPTDVIDVNLASKVVSGHRFKNTPEEKVIKQLWGDSAQFDFAPFFNSMDLVFIDGAHSADYVKKDTENALKLIKPEGGIIIWHDSHLYGVVKYLSPWIKQNNLPVYFIKNTSLAVAGVREGKVFDLQL
jgi:predicted O-methyltransferase YrrM